MNQKKLGQVIPSSTLKNGSDLETTPSKSSHQYSPSACDDEVESEIMGGSGSSAEGSELTSRCLTDTSMSELVGEWDGSDRDEHEEKEDREALGESWSDIESKEKEGFFSSPNVQNHITNHTQSGNNRYSRMVLASKTSSRKQDQEEEEKGSEGKLEATAVGGRISGRKNRKNRKKDSMRKEERDRKETGERQEKELTSWAEEEQDLFADMAPKITTGSTSLFPGPSSLHADTDRDGVATTKPSSHSSVGGLHSNSDIYQPRQLVRRQTASLCDAVVMSGGVVCLCRMCVCHGVSVCVCVCHGVSVFEDI